MNKDTTTISLTEGCKKNDRLAQKNLYYGYYDAVIRICIANTRNEHDAVEVLNNGFLKVFKNIAAYDAGKGSLYTWIRKLIVNAAIDFLKQRYAFEEVKQPMNEEADVAAVDAMKDKFEEEQVQHILQTLPPATETIFRLFALDGYSHKEIAGFFFISEGTSKWHVHQARVLLKKYLLTAK